MAEAPQQAAPPVGEEIHMPEPSMLPIVNAVGIAIAIIGITISLVLVIAGVLVFLASTLVWIVKARREMDHLPAEHHH
jgi:hypothetical protein